MADGFRLVETRSIAETMDRLGENPDSLVLLELHPGHGERLLSLLRHVARGLHRASAVVIGDRHSGPWDDLVREAGAIDYIESPRQIGRLIDLIHRHAELARLSEANAESNLSLEERILANLPWGN
jgi:DNA-binding NtrC family response regulator